MSDNSTKTSEDIALQEYEKNDYNNNKNNNINNDKNIKITINGEAIKLKDLEPITTPTKDINSLHDPNDIEIIDSVFTGVSGLNLLNSDMSLSDIMEELETIMTAANNGNEYDADRLDYLIKAQIENPEYQMQLASEYECWLEEINPFLEDSLNIMRSFVPLDIFSANYDKLIENGLTPEIAKRIQQKKCLYLVRMSRAEISRLHEVDLANKYNVSAQNLDIIELSSIYSSLPDRFQNDNFGKKYEWKEWIEKNLKIMYNEKKSNCLPKGKLRNSVYNNIEIGPFLDLTSVKKFELVVGANPNQGSRKSFQETCKRYSLLSRDRTLSSPSSSPGGSIIDNRRCSTGSSPVVSIDNRRGSTGTLAVNIKS
jgi:hypothetical protein